MAETGGDHRIMTKSGDTFIPASQRADGTWRKERRVKTGYIPQEEQPKYESKGRQIAREKPTYPVGLAPDQLAEHVAALSRNQKTGRSIPGLSAETIDAARANAAQSAASGSGKKKKGRGHGGSTTAFTMEAPAAASKKPVAAVVSPNAAITPDDHINKKIRNLQKKLSDIDALQARIDSGELKQPEKTQLDKIQRRPEILQEIDSLQAELQQLGV